MKILFNCLTMEKGGTERVISVLSNNLSLDNDVFILTFKKTDIKYEIAKNIKLYSVSNVHNKKETKVNKILSKISLIKLQRMFSRIKEIKPDIIISFLPEPSLKLMLIKKLNKQIRDIPTIISIRNDPNVEYKNKIIYLTMKWLYKDVDKLVLQTEEAKKYFEKILAKDKLVIIPNPIDSKFLVSKPYEGKRNQEIVTVGRLYAQKNQRLLISAFKKISLIYKDMKLLIYGQGPLEKELKNYVNSLNLENKIIFKGQVDDIKKAIYKAKLFVLSSDYEGMPNALMEAMALGLPCISTDCPCGGPKMLIDNNKNGILVKVNNLEELEKAILNLLQDEKKCQEISKNAFLDSQKYETLKICDLWRNVIEKIIEK